MTRTALLTKLATVLGTGLYIAVGTGTGTFDDVRTTMFSELVRAAVGAYTVGVSTLTLEAALTTAQGVGTLTEIAVFDAVSAGNMLVHQIISPSDVKPNSEGRVLMIQIPFVGA